MRSLVNSMGLISLLLLRVAPVGADVRISNMNDLSLGSWSGSGDVEDSDSVCIYNNGGPNYLITASGSGTGGAFTLSSGGNTIAYTFQFQGSSGGYTTLSPNSGQGFSSADQVSDTCGGSTNASMRVRVTESSLMSAKKGSYSGTVNVQVDPN